MSDNQVVTTISMQPDTASIEKTKAAVAGVEKDIASVSAAIEKAGRARALDELPKKFADIAAETGDTRKAAQQLESELKELGASSKEIDKITAAFVKAESAARDAIKEANSYEGRKRRAQESGADFSGDVASTTGATRGALDALSGGNAGAIGGILEGVEAIADLGEAAPLMASQISSAAASLGPAGLAAGAALAVLALVISDFAAGAQAQADEINAAIDATRSINEKIAAGLTTEDAEAEIANLERRRELENEVLAESQAAYTAFIEGIREKFGFFAPVVEGFLNIFDTREEALNAQIEKSKEITSGYTAEIDALNKAMGDGKTVANDRAKKEEESKKEKEKEQEKAAADTEKEKEKAIADTQRAQEKAAAEAQRQAEQISQAQKQVAASGEKYRNAVQDINASLGNAIADIRRKSADGDSDSRKTFNRDIAGISLKAQDDEKAARRKSYADLEKIDKDYRKNLADISKSAADAEENARSSRNFLQLAEARKEQQKAIDNAGDDAKGAVSERLNQDKIEATERLEQLKVARRDRKIALDQELADSRTNRLRAERDAKVNADRQLEQAKINRDRERAELQKHLNELLSARKDFYGAEMAAASGVSADTAKGGAGSGAKPSGFTPIGGGIGGGITAAPIRGGGGTTNNVNNKSLTVNTGANANDVMRVLKKAGYA